MRLSVGTRFFRVAGALAIAALLAFGGAPAVAAAPVVYRIEPESTYAEFAVSHLGLFRQRGHFGLTRGTIVLDPEKHSGSIDFTVDVASIDTGWNLRDEFLRGENMFDAARYPVVRFHSTQLVFDRERLIGVAGDLTLRDVTRPVALKVERLECGREPEGGREGCGAGVATSFKRSEFGMNYALALVGDDIDLSFQVTAFRVGP
ncbi:MAG TPA: YceI family protein [Casimicrobiaceae bacterium]|nr:YceI family protein [Casimicrobiaceae bacterium]